MLGELPHAPDWPMLHEYEGLLLHRNVPVADLATACRGWLVYLATPYSRRAVDENGAWCLDLSIAAAAEATAWAWRLTRAGLSVVSPVMLSAQMLHDEYAAECPHADATGPREAPAWEAWCRPMLSASDMVAIAPMRGWEVSLGVWCEAVAALGANKPVFVMEGR